VHSATHEKGPLTRAGLTARTAVIRQPSLFSLTDLTEVVIPERAFGPIRSRLISPDVIPLYTRREGNDLEQDVWLHGVGVTCRAALQLRDSAGISPAFPVILLLGNDCS